MFSAVRPMFNSPSRTIDRLSTASSEFGDVWQSPEQKERIPTWVGGIRAHSASIAVPREQRALVEWLRPDTVTDIWPTNTVSVEDMEI